MIGIRVTGNKQLIAKLDRLSRKLEREPNNIIQRAADEAYLHALVIAPRRTGELAVSIKKQGGNNWARISLGNGLGYPTWIDQGIVTPNWGTNLSDPKMIDKRPRSEKLHFFVGTDSNEGKTLAWTRQNFPNYVDELERRLEFR
jgi:hypothetical protein